MRWLKAVFRKWVEAMEMDTQTYQALEKALRAISELAFQMLTPDAHPHIGAIQDWAQKGLNLLAQEQEPISDHNP